MTPAAHIIQKFGGTRAMARAMEREPSTVHRWKLSGFIPGRHHLAVIEAAERAGVRLRASDFMPRRAVAMGAGG